MAQKNITGPMSKAEAQAITDRIRGAIDDIYVLVKKAKDGKAWKALGYQTWEAYVTAEFGMSRRRADQLLEKGEVVEAIEGAAGKAGNAFPISKRDIDAVKSDLPSVTAEIEQRVEAGEDPEQAVRETIEATRAAKAKAKAERETQQAENDRHREEHAANLPAFVAAREEANADVIAARKRPPTEAEFDALHAENEELREANAALEADVARLTAENKFYDEMKVQFALGGFDKVIAGKDKVIEGLETRVYRESADKASWMKLSKFWETEAKKLGFSRNAEIDIQTGEVTNG